MQIRSCYPAAKSALTLAPTEYTRRLFPDFLRPRIVTHFEGFDVDHVAHQEQAGIALWNNARRLGFAARDLSTAKGLDIFAPTMTHLIRWQPLAISMALIRHVRPLVYRQRKDLSRQHIDTVPQFI